MQYITRAPLAAISVGLALLLPALASAAQTTVNMTSNNVFSPNSVSIVQGDAVVWVNLGSSVNSVRSDTGGFDSGPMQANQQFAVVFSQPGVYKYHSTYYGGAGGQGMSGTVIVNAVTNTGTYVNPNVNYAVPTSGAVGTPTNASALYAQVQSLLAQIQALQAQGGAGVVSTGGTPVVGTVPYNTSQCPQIGRTLKLGASGDDVRRLQQFLARESSVYPEGTASGYFGTLTQAAVQRWQAKYNVVSSGSPDTTGYGVVGPRTAAAISLLCSTGSVNGVAGPVVSGTGGTVGGFIQVTPTSGAAPLVVNVTATVNTAGSCTGATYTLDFGDGTVPQQVQATPGNCSQQSQTFQHTYIYGGVYQITLAAGVHRTSATVTISGPAAPGGVGGPVIGTVGQARGTISAITTSGNAPLSVTFYVSCAAGTAYNVSFGDGTDLGGTAVSGTKCNSGALDSITHAYTKTGSFQAKLLIFSQQANGTVSPTEVGSVTITVGSIASSYSYNPPQLTSGSTALSFTMQFDLPTACTGYDLSWGDGTAHITQTDGGSGCSQTTTTISQSHTFTQSGAYTIVLKRGSSLGRTDTISVVVSQ